MQLRENIAVSETGFIFDPNSGESFSVNSTGKEILKLLSSSKTMDEIEETLNEKYEIDHLTFVRYMDDFLHTLRRFNLLETDQDE